MSTLLLKLTILITYLIFIGQDLLAQEQKKFSYAYISIEGKLFSKKLKVVIDFGDNPEQIKVGEEYSELLTNKKSYAAVLNYMVDKGFDLVETLSLTAASHQGTGSGTSGIIFIMRKKE